MFPWPESICVNWHIQNDSIAPLSIFFMVSIAPINEIQLRHIMFHQQKFPLKLYIEISN
jgi:hypothetical protein